MRRLKSCHRIPALLALACLSVWQSAFTPLQQGPIRVLAQDIVNDYPNALTFTLRVEADAAIIDVSLLHHLRGDTTRTRERIPITPANRVDATYFWDTSRETVPPSAPVLYAWEIRDSAGNEYTTPEQLVEYDDLRFPWRELRDDQLVVRWYRGNQEFGDFIFQTARQGLNNMLTAGGQPPEIPLMVLVYANDADFESWHFYVHEWVGGQAFPSLGITTQIIDANADHEWILSVIPHEIAHLFFYQLIHTHLESWPSWLDEGLAQYYELVDNSAALERAASAARQGRLIALRSLYGGFGTDPNRVRLSYDESLSVVVFIMQHWGAEGIQTLIKSLSQGTGLYDALEKDFGLSFEEFEAAWITWMGVPATPAPSPTPRPTFGIIMPPQRPALTAAPTSQPSSAATPAITLIGTPSASPDGIPRGTPFCSSAIMGVLLVAIAIATRTPRDHPHSPE
jgi:hypothetical protein